MKIENEKFYCESCGKKLRGLIRLSPGDEVVKNPVAKCYSSKYPLCDRCWIAQTEEGKQHNSKKVLKVYRAHNPKRKVLTLANLQKVAFAKGARIGKQRGKNQNLYKVYNNRFKTPVVLYASHCLTDVRDWLIYPEKRKELEGAWLQELVKRSPNK